MRRNPKIILLGETRKTSIIQTLIHGTFLDKPMNTVGACFHTYSVEDTKGQLYPMDLWDTAGQQKFRSLLTLYYKNSDAVVIVFDITDSASLSTVDYWAKQIQNNCDTQPLILLLGNKIDLRKANFGVKKQQIQSYRTKHPKWEYMECSAKDQQSVKAVFKVVAKKIKDQEKQKQKQVASTRQKIHPSKLRKTSGSSSCC